MQRRLLGRDLRLTIRMGVALALLALLYLTLVAISLGLYLLWPDGWPYWLAVAAAIAFGLAAHYHSAGELILRSVGGTVVNATDEPELCGRLERLASLAGLPAPRLAVVASEVPNAFAVGTSARRSIVAVTTALVDSLDAAELDSVLAHELAHVANRDAAVMTAAGVPRTLGQMLVGDEGLYGLVWLVVWPIGIPLFAAGSLIQLTISRYREFAADRGSALLAGAPEQLMSALQKLSRQAAPGTDLRLAGVEALCIVPVRERRYAFLMDHPPLHDRLDALAEIARKLGKLAA